MAQASDRSGGGNARKSTGSKQTDALYAKFDTARRQQQQNQNAFPSANRPVYQTPQQQQRNQLTQGQQADAARYQGQADRNAYNQTPEGLYAKFLERRAYNQANPQMVDVNRFENDPNYNRAARAWADRYEAQAGPVRGQQAYGERLTAQGNEYLERQRRIRERDVNLYNGIANDYLRQWPAPPLKNNATPRPTGGGGGGYGGYGGGYGGGGGGGGYADQPASFWNQFLNWRVLEVQGG